MSIGIEVGIALGTHTGLSGISTISTPATGVTGLFVDKTVAQSTTYDPDTRTIGSGDQPVYSTIQAAVNAILTGEAIYVRGALSGGTETYFENVLISGSTVPSGTAGNYCSLQSYPGEWAEVDGQNNQQYTIGKNASGRDEGNWLSYWKFERLGITGGTNGVDQGAGLSISGGPFIVRFNDIHDNIAAAEGENPCGLMGYSWIDCEIRYNRFFNNGMASGLGGNAAHIVAFTDYITERDFTAQFGYQERVQPCARNDVAYNYFDTSTVGFKHKGAQLFSGRNLGGANFADTFATYGDTIHHNFFTGHRRQTIISEQDFCQVYQNIIEDTLNGIEVQYEPGAMMYKACNYNNTFKDHQADTKGINRYGRLTWSSLFTESQVLWGYDLNNLHDAPPASFAQPSGSWFVGRSINALGDFNHFPSPDFSNYVASHNYMYRPGDDDLFKMDALFYTAAEWEAQAITASPKVVYTKPTSEGSGNLYEADGYTTRGAHIMETGVTIADGGIGGAHPFLAGVIMPSFVGHANPLDNAWVAGVITEVSSVAWLKTQVGDTDPTWIEA